jgi:putative ABC transport system permease protein
MNALAFAWRSLVRQPARAALGILGVAAVGALLFDMLLLSEGLVLSMRDLLARVGFDVRVRATMALPGSGPSIADAGHLAAAIAQLPEVDEAVALGVGYAEIDRGRGRRPLAVDFVGADISRRRVWTVTAGRDIADGRTARGAELLVNRNVAARLGAALGEALELRASCTHQTSALPQATFTVVGIAEFPFDSARQLTVATTFADFGAACGAAGSVDGDMILVASGEGSDSETTRNAIARLRPDLNPMTNEQMVGLVQQSGLTYFRQISAVLMTVTLSFGTLLITVLLTVSVNQRLAEIAALRALGFSQRRVVLDVLCESALVVGLGGLLALPLGAALAVWLDGILKRMPGLPVELHFFVFHPQALGIHLSLLVATAVIAALYPMWLVARLPIATTLRNEVIS